MGGEGNLGILRNGRRGGRMGKELGHVKALSTRSAIKVSKNFKDFSKMGNQQEIYLVWTF